MRGSIVWCVAVALGLAAATTVGLLPSRAAAITYTWTGGVNGNWSNAGNWSGGAAPTSGGKLVFPSGASNLTTTDDLPAGTSYASLTISGNGYTLAGNGISLAGKLTDSNAGGANTIALDIAFPASETIAVSYAAETLTVSGAISGAGMVTKASAGGLVLSGTNTFTGGFTMSGGTLSIGSDANLGAVPGSPTAANVTFKGTLYTTGTFAIAANRGIALSSTATIDVAPGTTLTYGGIATGSGALTKADSGTLVLSGANATTGAMTLTGGILSISSDANLGTAPASAKIMLTFNGGNLDTTATFTLNGNRNLKFTQNATIDVAPGTTLTYGGVASGSGTSLTLPDTGTLLLTGTSTYTGDTNVTAGTLMLGSAATLSASSDVVLAGTLDLDGNSNTIGSLAGTGTVTDSSATAATLTTNKDNASTAFSGTIADGAGSVSLVKVGTGTLTLSGHNTFSGTATVSAGTLQYGSATALPTTSDVTSTGSAELDIAGYDVTIGSLAGTGGVEDSGAAATLTTNGDNASTSFTGIIADLSGPLSLIKAGTGTLTLGGTNTYTGTTTVSAGTLQLSKKNALSASSDVTVDATLDIDGTAQTLGSLAGTGIVEDSGAAATLTANADDATTTFSGLIEDLSGPLSLTKSGTGALTLTDNNTYSGATSVAAGTLYVDGSQASSNVTLQGGTLGGSGTVGTITSGTSGGTFSPGDPTDILTGGNLKLTAGSPTFNATLDGPSAGTDYSQFDATGTVNINGASLAISLGYTPANGQVFTILSNAGGSAVTGTFAGLPEGSTLAYDGTNFTISYVGGSGHDITLTAGTPSIALVLAVSPSGGQNPGTNLTYTATFTNAGYTSASQVVISDPVPAHTDFEVGSATASLGSTGLTAAIAYSDDGGATYAYTPVSGGGGAQSGYDRNVTNVRWTLTGTLVSAAPNNTGTVSMTAIIR